MVEEKSGVASTRLRASQYRRTSEIFLLLVCAFLAHLTPLDRFEHEHPESFAFPPHRMLDAIGYAKFYSRSHDAVIRVYDQVVMRIALH
jgi:hypothetical protein